MLLTRHEPFSLFDQFNNEINRYFTSTRTRETAAPRADWAPAVDIIEEKNRYLLAADIPGVRREDVDITLEDNVLTIKGIRTARDTTDGERYTRRERAHGRFARQFTLPDTTDSSNISAAVKDGVLAIEIPKHEKILPKKISVK